MVQHGPKVLEGPIIGSSPWWQEAGEQDQPSILPFKAKGKRRGKRADPPIRTDLVERVRKEIAEGTYDTPQRWDAALDRMFETL